MAGTENPKIPPFTEHTQNWAHEDIKNSFDGVNPEGGHGAATKYTQAKDKWSKGLETFKQRMTAAIAESWEGKAAEASKLAIGNYVTEAAKLTDSFDSIAKRITTAADAAAKTKQEVPGLVDGAFKVTDLDTYPWNRSVLAGERSDAEEDARAKMRLYYVEPFAEVDALPVLPRPVTADKPLDISAPTTGDTDPDSGKPTDGDNPKPGGDTPSPSTVPANTESPSTNPASTGTPSTGTPAATTAPASTGTPGSAAPTSPATTNVPSSNVPTSSTPRSGNPGSGNPGSGIPGSGIPTTGTPKSVPGTPGAALTGTGGSNKATAASAGRNGMPGMMGAGAGRGKSEDDDEHTAPDYLVNEANTQELIGEIPKVAPAVLGAKFAAAQVQPREPGQTDSK